MTQLEQKEQKLFFMKGKLFHSSLSHIFTLFILIETKLLHFWRNCFFFRNFKIWLKSWLLCSKLKRDTVEGNLIARLSEQFHFWRRKVNLSFFSSKPPKVISILFHVNWMRLRKHRNTKVSDPTYNTLGPWAKCKRGPLSHL